jgi:hypothetical protein
MLVTNRAFSSLREGTIRAKHTHGSALTLGRKTNTVSTKIKCGQTPES